MLTMAIRIRYDRAINAITQATDLQKPRTGDPNMEMKRRNLPEKRPIITAEQVVQKNDPRRAPDVLAHYTGLPKARIKEAMGKGAVWLKRGGRRPMRLRRVTTTLKTGDRLA